MLLFLLFTTVISALSSRKINFNSYLTEMPGENSPKTSTNSILNKYLLI